MVAKTETISESQFRRRFLRSGLRNFRAGSDLHSAALPPHARCTMRDAGCRRSPAGGKKQYYLDQEIALYLLGGGNNGRYCDAAAGRFLSEDPTKQDGTSKDSNSQLLAPNSSADINLYCYAGNDPINNLDPSGHDSKKDPPKPVYHPPQTQPAQQHNKKSGGGFFSGLKHAWHATTGAISGAAGATWNATKHAAEATGHAVAGAAKAAWNKAKYAGKVLSYLPRSLKRGTAAVGADLAKAVTLGKNKYVNEVDKRAWQKTDAGKGIQTASRVLTGISAGAAVAAGGAVAVEAGAAAAPVVAGAARAALTNPTIVGAIVRGAPIAAGVIAAASNQPDTSVETPVASEVAADVPKVEQAATEMVHTAIGDVEKVATTVEHDLVPAEGKAEASSNDAKGAAENLHQPTSHGSAPSERTIGRRFWKNEAKNPSRSDYTSEDVARMRRGEPPQRYNRAKGAVESMERSHEPIPRRQGGTQMVPRWPQEHAQVDPYRRPGY